MTKNVTLLTIIQLDEEGGSAVPTLTKKEDPTMVKVYLCTPDSGPLTTFFRPIQSCTKDTIDVVWFVSIKKKYDLNQ